MYWKWLALWMLLVGVGCNNQNADLRVANDPVAAAGVVAGVAWSERVEIQHSLITPNPPVSVQVRVGSGTPFGAQVLFQGSGRVVFDLPPMPALPDLPLGLPNIIGFAAYQQFPSADQQNGYGNRGKVTVRVLKGNQEIASGEYQPYGSVEPGQLTLIRNGACSNLSAGFTQIDRLEALVGETRVCFIVAGFINRGTQEASAALSAALPGSSLDKNVLYSLDQTGANAFDPTCGQIGRWLNPIGGSGFSNIDMNQLASYTNSAGALVNNNRGVMVYVVGGGFGSSDGFSCPIANMQGHDKHVGNLIRTLAPRANIQAKEVCDDMGNCLASRITRALLEIGATPSGNTLINASLGGPLANSAMFRALQLLQDRVLLVASGGNGPFSPRHYPASYSSSLPTPGPLNNVIAVGAAGVMGGTWGIAGFNTRRNGEISAPGINLCPTSALEFRCKNSTPISLDDLGLTGSSFAAPVVTGLAALYLDHALPNQTLTPIRLRQCLNNTSAQNPNLSGMVWFNPNGC